MGKNKKGKLRKNKSSKKNTLLSKCVPQIPNPIHFIIFGFIVTICFVFVFTGIADETGPMKPKIVMRPSQISEPFMRAKLNPRIRPPGNNHITPTITSTSTSTSTLMTSSTNTMMTADMPEKVPEPLSDPKLPLSKLRLNQLRLNQMRLNEPKPSQSVDVPAERVHSSPSWDSTVLSDIDQALIKETKIQFEPPNPDFIFHNKLPKSGSSTMNQIFSVLSKWNHFKHMKLNGNAIRRQGYLFKGFSDEDHMISYMKKIYQPPMTILKHHFWFNFTEHNMEAPTWINIMREPISWFESRFWFDKNGWARKEGARNNRKSNPDNIDKCIEEEHRQCKTIIWHYMRFFCGNKVFCQSKDDTSKKKALEYAKQRFLNDFFVIGILEQFDDTLKLFEKLIPKFFKGAPHALVSKHVQGTTNKTKTKDKISMSLESRQYLSSGPLKYEIDLYNFARALFNRKLQAAGLSIGKTTV